MLKCSVNTGQVEAFLLKASDLIREYIIKGLSELARESAEKARNRGEMESWHNQTGNLRSSIGAAVYDHGVTVMQTAFETILSGSRGSAGGRRMVQSLANEYREAVCMVIIAGMDYAEIVEALDSRDVLESTRIWAESVAEGRIRKSVEEAVKVINSWRI